MPIVMEDTILALRADEANQRSQFQFDIFRLNLIANAGLIAFALRDENEWSQALLACPLISLVLFALWFHHGIAIKMDTAELNVDDCELRAPKPILGALRQVSVSIAVLGNFVVVPLVALSIFRLSQSSWIMPFAVSTLVITSILYIFWFGANYFTKERDAST